ncbi:MAG: sugar ABC transporter substrate-binding protein [Dermatophilaceae bacterium]
MTRKTIGVTTGVATMLLAATACSGGDTSAADGDRPSGERLVLTSLDYYTDEPAKSLYEAAVGRCADEVGVEVRRESVPGGELVSTVLQRASSDDLPDILILDNPDVLQIADTGGLMPLDTDGLDLADRSPGMRDSATADGKLYGLAPIANTLALFYNKKLLAEAGVQPPRTWAELRATAKRLTRGDTYGLAFAAPASYEGSWQFLPFMWTNGGDETDLTSPEVAESADYLRSLIDDGVVSKSVVTWGQGDVNDQFSTGKAAMMINGPWNIPALKKVQGLEWDAVTVPVNRPGQTPVAPLGGEVWTVAATGDDAAQAKAAEVVTCVNAPEQQLELALATYTVPTDDTLTEQLVAKAPEMKAFADQVATARSRTGKLGADWPKAGTVIYTGLQATLTGSAPGTDAFKAAAADAG